ncbi:Nodulation-signaling pathway 2 protein [Camellia lanceoleosa]|uniref:Nodulation-signaling pathway 2 protein n=1 Tax=Camellia lanceoleosa TaxID=1840588 RepID=A0ACC0G5N1_9ERIC|nr:Nodulation-signaling pathway 2 protein [Camellia lanceoleosa]
MQPKFLQSPWPFFNNVSSPFLFNEFGDFGLAMDVDMDDCNLHFCPPFITTEDYSLDKSKISTFPSPTALLDEFSDPQVHVKDSDTWLPEDDFSIAVDDFGIEILSKSPEKSEESLQLTLPTENMEINNVIHLIKAYREAIDEGKIELSEVIMKRISEKVSPVGGVMDRLLYYLFQSFDKQADYLRQESNNNFLAAFMTFYQIFPYGKFAHFAANRAILQAMPHDVELIHIIDFDMGEGIQWPSMIEAIGWQQRKEIRPRLTSVKWSEGDSDSPWRFAETRRWLCDHAQAFCVKLTVDTMELHDLVNEMKTMKRNGRRREWLVFNCMLRLPHMGRVRSRRDLSKFLRVAKELLAYVANCNFDRKSLRTHNSIIELDVGSIPCENIVFSFMIRSCARRRTNFDNMGIIAFGDGDVWMNPKISSSFGSFLDGHLVHYKLY